MNPQVKEESVPTQVTAPGEINIRVKDQNNNVICFKLKRTTKFKRLMESYCNRNGFALNAVRFIFEGESLKETDTPEQLKMGDTEEIDAITEQLGGKNSNNNLSLV